MVNGTHLSLWVLSIFIAGSGRALGDEGAWTALHGAAAAGDVGKIEALLKDGAAVNAQSLCDGELQLTPLDLAVHAGEKAAAEILRKAGARHSLLMARAVQANAEGFRLYKKGRYREALAHFEEAISTFASYPPFLAVYNAAAVEALLAAPKNKQNCSEEHYRKCLEHLNNIRTPLMRQKVREDADFDGIRRNADYIELIYMGADGSLDYGAVPFFRDLLTETYSTSAPGSSYSPTQSLTLAPDGVWTVTFHENAGELMGYWYGDKDPEGPIPKLKLGRRSGRWRLEGTTLILSGFGPKGETERYENVRPGQIGEYYYPDPDDESGESRIAAERFRCW